MSERKGRLSRREMLRTGALAVAGAAAGMVFNKTTLAQGKIGSTIDVHGHLWSDDYLDLMEKYLL